MSAAFDHLDELSRGRGLSEQETARLESHVKRMFRKTDRTFWDRASERRLKQYVERGKSPRQIAPLLGRTEGAVWSHIRILRRRGEIAYYKPDWAKLSPNDIPEAAE